MANFMGPMAPPQAAPPQPAQLDIRTNPGQRAQFKSFMQGMQTPPTTAPIAPMLPAPMMSPMDQVDIFAPAPMADGGVVGGLQDLGQMSGQMVEALNTVIYGGGQGMGGGIGSVMQTPPGSLPPALPNIESGVYKHPMNTPMEMPSGFPFANSITTSGFFDVERPGYLESMHGPANDSRQMGDMERYRQAQEDARRQREDGFMGRVMLPGEGSFEDFMNMQPQSDLLQQTQLYEDGGPVGMRRGGVTFESGRTYETGRGIGEQNREMDALDAVNYSNEGIEEAMRDAGFPDPFDSPFGGGDDGGSNDDQYDAPKFTGGIGTGNTGSASITVNRPQGGATYFADNQPPGGTISIKRASESIPDTSSAELFETLDPVTQSLIMQDAGGDSSALLTGQDGPTSISAVRNFGTSNDQIDDFDMLTLGTEPYYVEPDSNIDPSNTGSNVPLVGQQNLRMDADQSAINLAQFPGAFSPDVPGVSVTTPGGGLMTVPVNMTPINQSGLTPNQAEAARQAIFGTDDTQATNFGETPDLGLGFGYLSKPLVEGSVIDFPFYSYPEPPITDPSADPNALSPAEELAIARGNPPTPGPNTGSGDSSVLLTGQDGDTTGEIYTPELQLANLANLRIKGTGNEKIDGRTVVNDLNTRTAGADAGFSPAGILAKALGGGMATKIAKNVLSGDPDVFPVIDSSTNQIIGYSGEGGRGYTGRPGYNPLQAGLRGGGDRVRYDPATGAYFVDPLDPSAGSPDEQSDIVEMNRLRAAQEAVTPPPADVADPIVPPADPIVTPPLPPVVAPSPRDPVDITAPILTGGVPGIGPAGITAPILTGPNMGVDPLAPVGLPQSFLDLLASFNRPAPRAMQDGGAVLDKAADDFLGALKSVA